MKTVNILLGIIILLTSCDDFFDSVVDLKVPEHQSKLAVTAVMGNGEGDNKSLIVSYSIGGLEEVDDGQLINNATVSIDNTIVEFTGSDGIYALPEDFNFAVGETYTLQVDSPDYQAVTAEQVYPSAVQVDAAEVNSQYASISFHDPANSSDAYLIKFYRKDINNQWVKIWIWPNNTTTYADNYNGEILINDELFNGENYSLNFEYSNYYGDYQENQNTTYKVILLHFNREYYRYLHTVKLNDEAEGNPFAEPVIVYSNIENGYGIFALTNQSEYIIE